MHNAKALPFALLLSTPLVAPAHAQEAEAETVAVTEAVAEAADAPQ